MYAWVTFQGLELALTAGYAVVQHAVAASGRGIPGYPKALGQDTLPPQVTCLIRSSEGLVRFGMG